MPALPPVPIRRHRLHTSVHGRHPLSPEAKLAMHCELCCDALWVEPFSGVEIHMEMDMEWKWMEMGHNL